MESGTGGLTMAADPYRVPDDGRNRIVNVSGGRSSGMMLAKMLDAHGGRLPPGARPVFCNTGKEREETLAFVREMGERWGVAITWLEYRHDPDAPRGRKHHHVVVDFASASRRGEPFEHSIRASAMLPTVTRRACTHELKAETAARFARRDLGWPSHRSVIGFRYDEAARWRRALVVGKCDMDFPMVVARATRRDVEEFWDDQPFDLGIPSELGNCDLCFLKGKAKLLGQMRAEPARAAWWIEQEEWVKDKRPHVRKREHLRFRERWSYAQLLELATGTAELPFADDGAVADCFCGD